MTAAKTAAEKRAAEDENKSGKNADTETDSKNTFSGRSAEDVGSDDGDSGSNDEPERLGSQDVLNDLKAAQGPLQPTAVDANGVERIVGPAIDTTWRPAQVDPTDEDMERAEAVVQAEKDRREERLGATSVAADNLGDGAEVTKGAFEAERS